MKKPEKMLIYNIFPLLVGKLSEWEPHLSRASEMGFNWIFVNPIQRPGLSGSLYAIKDYFAFNPLFVDGESDRDPREQVRRMIDTAERLGLRVMIDLVINHCSVDSNLIETHPEWFEWQSKDEVAHPFAKQDGKKVVWGDLAKFDHRNSKDKEGLFQFCFDVVRFLLDVGFKGFRCDAAYQLPKSFWERLIRETRKLHPDVYFFAETLGCTPDQTKKTALAGFDYIFNSSKWWDFKSRWLMKQYALTRDIVPSISFPESHDTVRLLEECSGNVDNAKQRYLFTALFSKGIMMPIGFEFGFRKKPHVVKTRPDDWEQTGVDLTSFIRNVNQIKIQHSVFQEEAPTEIIPNKNPKIMLMWKASTFTQEESVLILNTDIWNMQHFSTDNLHEVFQTDTPIADISPEHALESVPARFSYDLKPGQGIVLITSREAVPED